MNLESGDADRSTAEDAERLDENWATRQWSAALLFSGAAMLGIVVLEALRLRGASTRLRDLGVTEWARQAAELVAVRLRPILPEALHRRLDVDQFADRLQWGAGTVALHSLLAGIAFLGVFVVYRLSLRFSRLPARRREGGRASLKLAAVSAGIIWGISALPAVAGWQETLRYRVADVGLPKLAAWPLTLIVMAGMLWLAGRVARRIGATTAGTFGARTVGGAAVACWALFLWGVLFSGLGSSRPVPRPVPPPDAPNVLLISIDSLRADHLGAYGYARDTSPAIDELATGGVLFEQAFAPASWTLPSHVAMLSGRYPATIGVRDGYSKIPDDVPLLAEELRGAGYRTAGLVAGAYLDASYGFDRGFDRYDDFSVVSSLDEETWGETSSSSMRHAMDWLRKYARPDRQPDERPFFFFLHLWDVHYDYTPPAPYDRFFDPDYEGDADFSDLRRNSNVHAGMDPRDAFHLEALYDGEIRYTDGWIAKLLHHLADLGVADDTLVVLTADHGEEFFEHGGKEHSTTLYRESVQVPLIFRWPNGLPQGKRRPELVSLVDVAPTIYELAVGRASGRRPFEAALVSQAECAGRALDVAGGSSPALRRVYGSLGFQDQLSIRSGDRAFLVWESQNRGRDEKLFDSVFDPGELRDVGAGEPARIDELRALESLWFGCWTGRGQRRDLDPALEEKLRSFGYLE